MDKNSLIYQSVDSTSIRSFCLKFFLGDSNLAFFFQFFSLFEIEIWILSIKDSNPSLGWWIFSTFSEVFALWVRFIFETLSNLIKNNNTSVLISSKSNKGSTCPNLVFFLSSGFWPELDLSFSPLPNPFGVLMALVFHLWIWSPLHVLKTLSTL